MDIVKLNAGSPGNAGMTTVAMRCPACRREATLDQVEQDRIKPRLGGAQVTWGYRRCPNESCGALIFVVIDAGHVIASWPPETVDFDATDLPPKVLAALEEAITCHAHNCYVAAAIMVRKTLEEVCADRQAQGGTLYARLEDLRGKLLLPKEMFDALHDLRLLGNDAAHVELSDFDAIDEAKLDAALEIAKEILKAAYQYTALMGKLDALKTQTI